MSLLSVPEPLWPLAPQSGAWRCLGAVSTEQHLGGQCREKHVGLLHGFHDRLGIAEPVGASMEKRRVMGQDGERLSFLSPSLLPRHARGELRNEAQFWFLGLGSP